MKNYYLVKTQTYFVDPHGEPDEGGITKEVEMYDDEDDPLKNLDLSLEYTEDLTPIDEDSEDYDEEDFFPPAEDGYNREVKINTFKKLTEQEYNTANIIIQSYNKL